MGFWVCGYGSGVQLRIFHDLGLHAWGVEVFGFMISILVEDFVIPGTGSCGTGFIA